MQYPGSPASPSHHAPRQGPKDGSSTAIACCPSPETVLWRTAVQALGGADLQRCVRAAGRQHPLHAIADQRLQRLPAPPCIQSSLVITGQGSSQTVHCVAKSEKSGAEKVPRALPAVSRHVKGPVEGEAQPLQGQVWTNQPTAAGKNVCLGCFTEHSRRCTPGRCRAR